MLRSFKSSYLNIMFVSVLIKLLLASIDRNHVLEYLMCLESMSIRNFYNMLFHLEIMPIGLNLLTYYTSDFINSFFKF